jgi:ribonuclease III
LSDSSKKKPDISQPDKDTRREREGTENGKIRKLLEALDDVLQSESAEVDGDILEKCKKLRGSLEKHRDRGVQSKHANPAAKQRQPISVCLYEYRPQIPQALSVTPWTSSSIPTTLPPLPAIYSPALETAVFTHMAVASHDSLSYERLEWVGDAYVELISTLLISSTLTAHTTGRLSQIREMCVKNPTLASYARSYGFIKRARLPPNYYQKNDAKYKDKYDQSTKVMGDIFEAYVAAVILSDPEDGLARATNWLKALWAQTIASDIKTQESKNQTGESGAPIIGQVHRNSKELLSLKILSKGVKLTYTDAAPEFKDPNTKLAVFTVGVYLNGWGEKDKELGVGKGISKRDAGMKAAEMALANTKLLSRYEEMKRVYDEDRRKEKEGAALEGGAGGVGQVIVEGRGQEVDKEKAALKGEVPANSQTFLKEEKPWWEL